ncbi:hypothetical protein [Kitasatospora sp. DSM 101779]|uniref:hypothetical protein n=1 Tax=Kitasatospora sp. DSM 101779 TaxID=2853165 RepID=UPI0021DB4645|nr:hypothetical protein [Kitasatospora sp. DSM 101779]MCU7820403.1 hypothetical protein [Kitasatospora sp. DSM 101779]
MDPAFTLAWQHAVGHVLPEDLPMAAAELLAEGLDSPALRDLAGRSRNEDTAELDALLHRAVAELGVAAPDHGTAERCLLHHLSARLVYGDLTPREVAARVWHGMAETATEPEARFLAVATEECCSCCLDSLDIHHPEAFRSWEARLGASAALLVSADDNPLNPEPSHRG